MKRMLKYAENEILGHEEPKNTPSRPCFVTVLPPLYMTPLISKAHNSSLATPELSDGAGADGLSISSLDNDPPNVFMSSLPAARLFKAPKPRLERLLSPNPSRP
jgi:hypothetical protein